MKKVVKSHTDGLGSTFWDTGWVVCHFLEYGYRYSKPPSNHDLTWPSIFLCLSFGNLFLFCQRKHIEIELKKTLHSCLNTFLFIGPSPNSMHLPHLLHSGAGTFTFSSKSLNKKIIYRMKKHSSRFILFQFHNSLFILLPHLPACLCLSLCECERCTSSHPATKTK